MEGVGFQLCVAALLAVLAAVHCQDDCSRRLDVTFIVDSHRSIRDSGFNNWNYVQQLVAGISGQFIVSTDAVQVSVVTFSTSDNSADLNIKFSDYEDKYSLQSALYQLDYSGGSYRNTGDGLRVAFEQAFSDSNGNRRDALNIVVLITNGDPASSGAATSWANELKRAGTRLLVIGITNSVSESTLTDLSSPPHAENLDYWAVQDFYDVNVIVDDVVQQICLSPGEKCQEADIGLLLDASGSINEEEDNWEALKDFLIDMIREMNVGPTRVRVGAVKYSNNAVVEFYMDQYTNHDQLESALRGMSHLGARTNTAQGLEFLRTRLFRQNYGDRENVKNIGIVITDGKSNMNQDDTSYQATLTKEAGIRLIVIGITEYIDVSELRDIASESNEVIVSPDFNVLPERLYNLLSLTCEGIKEKPRECREVDIGLVLDASTSITWRDARNWNPRLLGFVKDIVDAFPISYNQTRVGIVKFSDYAQVEFNLNRYYTSSELNQAIDSLVHTTGETNIAEGLRLLRQNIFNQNNGDRAEIKNIGILITDGQANKDATRTIPEAQLAKDAGIELFCVGIADVDPDELKNIASGDDHVFQTEDFDQLYQLITSVVESTCVTTTPVPTTTTSTSTTTTRPPTTTTTRRTTTTTRRTTTTRPPTTTTKKKKVPTATLR